MSRVRRSVPYRRSFWVVLLLGVAGLLWLKFLLPADTPRPSGVQEQSITAQLPVSEPVHPVSTNDAPSVSDRSPVRELVVSPQVAFTVRDGTTRAPISGAAVYAGKCDGREILGSFLGFTSPTGRLELELQLPDSNDPSFSYVAHHDNRYAMFERVATLQDAPTEYLAEFHSGETLRLTIVDECGQPVPAASLILSRRPVAVHKLCSMSAGKGPVRTPLPDMSDPISAVCRGTTASDGNFVVRGMPPGAYFWDALKFGYLPWGNNHGPTLSVPGDYTIVMHAMSGAALVVKGDEVVHYEHDMPAKVHQDSIRHALGVQEALVEKYGASIAYVAPASALLRSKSITVRLFLK